MADSASPWKEWEQAAREINAVNAENAAARELAAAQERVERERQEREDARFKAEMDGAIAVGVEALAKLLKEGGDAIWALLGAVGENISFGGKPQCDVIYLTPTGLIKLDPFSSEPPPDATVEDAVERFAYYGEAVDEDGNCDLTKVREIDKWLIERLKTYAKRRPKRL